MKVRDYYRDFVLHQKWGIQVHIYYIDRNDPLLNPTFETSNYYKYSVPIVERCKYFDSNVNFIKCAGDRITLDVNEYIFKE